MVTAAIIAEFNPFHNGHKFLIDEIKRKLLADRIIVIMSGDYVQRGQCAIINKQFRSQMAICEGADLVLLLPTVYSLSNADMFALSAVSILNKLNIVDYLCFASECGDIEKLCEINEKLNSRDYEIDNQIKELLNQGMTYAKARATLFPEYSDVLARSNNILALEYIRALKVTNSSMKPFTIVREGCDYNDESVLENQNASASAIRHLLSRDTEDKLLKAQLPSSVYKILLEQKKVSSPIEVDMFSEELYYALLSNLDNLTDYLDVSLALANKIKKNISSFSSISAFIDTLKTKELTHSRIARSLMHILLQIKGNNDYYRDGLKMLNHIRILAMSDGCKDLLSLIGKSSDIDLLGSVPKMQKSLNEFENEIFSQDLLASTLYDHIVFKEYGTKAIHEYSKKYL